MGKKKIKKKVFLAIFMLCLILTLHPVSASAEGLVPPEPRVGQTLILNAASDPSGAYDSLTAEKKAIYDVMKVQIGQVASGEITSTAFEGFVREHSFAEEETAKAAIVDAVNALYADLPYELYWYDAAKGFRYSITQSTSGDLVQYFVKSVKFYVSKNYSADGTAGTFVTGSDKIAEAKKAADEAERVVEENAQKSDIEKLRAYKDYICGKVSYDNNAAANGSAESTTPWHLINVFDDDPETNVVCEGYAKAFQYLCDLSEFTSEVECYRISGTLTSVNYDGEGVAQVPSSALHAWNIVRMDGQSYLIDVTNCDSGSAGNFVVGEDGKLRNPEGEGSGILLFMLCCGGVDGSDGLPEALTVEGSVESGYTVDRGKISFDLGGGRVATAYRHTVKYEYSDETRSFYPDEVLSLDVPEPLPENKLGDVNGDGSVNVIDARWLLQASSGNRILTEEEADVADVNGDGSINVIDARWLLQVASGNRTL